MGGFGVRVLYLGLGVLTLYEAEPAHSRVDNKGEARRRGCGVRQESGQKS